MDYLTVRGEAETRYEIKRSVFICSVKGTDSLSSGLGFVNSTAKKYPDATHVCYAATGLNGERKFSDGGEPQGTAGAPILGVLKQMKLSNTVCVVTRYFGGIKLGTGGLAAAYKKAACLCLEKLAAVNMRESAVFTVKTDYAARDRISRLVKETGCIILKEEYGDAVTVKYGVPLEKANEFEAKLAEATGGGIYPEKAAETAFLEY
jgi:uncharacterized YigZ family protein